MNNNIAKPNTLNFEEIKVTYRTPGTSVTVPGLGKVGGDSYTEIEWTYLTR